MNGISFLDALYLITTTNLGLVESQTAFTAAVLACMVFYFLALNTVSKFSKSIVHSFLEL